MRVETAKHVQTIALDAGKEDLHRLGGSAGRPLLAVNTRYSPQPNCSETPDVPATLIV
jgi:hypothetical protein